MSQVVPSGVKATQRAAPTPDMLGEAVFPSRRLRLVALVAALVAAPWTSAAQPRLSITSPPADLARACDAGNAEACWYLALHYQRGTGGLSSNPARAAVLFEKACDGRWATACTALGTMYQKGEGVTKDDARAQTFFDRGTIVMFESMCSVGHAPACATLGTMYQDGRGGLPKDEARAVPLLERGCQAGLAWACSRLKR